MRLVRNIAAATAALALGSVSASAQGISYTTTGTFTSGSSTCNGGPVCSGAGFTLTYLNATANNLGNGTGTSIGQFNLVGAPGSDVTAMGTDVLFKIMINQTSPTTGPGVFSGYLTGRVYTTPNNFSSLQFDPNQVVTIGSVTYSAIFDATGPAAGKGYLININGSSPTGLNVQVTATPEPSSMALLGTGLVGLVPMFRRRKNKA